MAQRPKPPVFLARSSYRQRRLRDAARLLPVLGGVLWMIPLLWRRGDGGQTNAAALLYLFGVWALLIALALLLSRRLRPDADASGLTRDEAD